MDRGVGNKTQKLHRCYSTFSPEKFVENNRLDNLQGKENSVSSEFTHYDRFSCTRSRIDRVTTDRKLLTKLKQVTLPYSFQTITIQYVLLQFPQKSKLAKIYGILIIHFQVNLIFPPAQKS